MVVTPHAVDVWAGGNTVATLRATDDGGRVELRGSDGALRAEIPGPDGAP